MLEPTIHNFWLGIADKENNRTDTREFDEIKGLFRYVNQTAKVKVLYSQEGDT